MTKIPAMAAVNHSAACGRSAGPRAGVRRPSSQATIRQSTRNIAAGTSAPRKMSWVLTMRTISLVTLVASVWARIMASPSRISTSDGGMTTPSVLATQTSAVLSAAGTPRAASLGATLRESMATLAPTEPFIGASSAPSPRVASAGALLLRRPSATPQRNSRSASGRRLSSAPMKT